jgi:hypothetical protein
MGYFEFDISAFRIAYPAFANEETFPDATLQAYFNSACCYISNDNYGWLAGNCRYTALTLMTAHLAALSVIIAKGKVPGLVQSATIDKVSVSLTPPLLENQWQWWLSLTPYGQQLFAMLQVNSAGGFYVGGSPETLAFRGLCGPYW